MIEFESKRNKVYKKNENTILKIFHNKENFENEIGMLEKLGDFAPKLKTVDAANLQCEMEFLNGELLLDVILKNNFESKALAQKMADTIVYIFEISGNIPFDENFRNYLVADDKIYRIDFEQSVEGNLQMWYAKIFAFALLYKGNQKLIYDFLYYLALFLNVDIKANLSLIYEEVAFLSKRWKVEFPKINFNTAIKYLIS